MAADARPGVSRDCYFSGMGMLGFTEMAARPMPNANMDATFIGVDLAWRSDANVSGLAALRGDTNGAELVSVAKGVRSRERVLAFIQEHVTSSCVVAIDAPLIIRNQSGQRPCETLVGMRYGGRHASCHTSNLTLYPDAASARLAGELALLGFTHGPQAAGTDQRVMIEVYPHAALVALFDLPTIIKYKKGTVAEKRRGLHQLRGRIAEFSTWRPALRSSEQLDRLLEQRLESLSGSALKQYEDTLDAVVCAYLALYFAAWGLTRNEYFGDAEHGYIMNPILQVSTSTR